MSDFAVHRSQYFPPIDGWEQGSHNYHHAVWGVRHQLIGSAYWVDFSCLYPKEYPRTFKIMVLAGFLSNAHNGSVDVHIGEHPHNDSDTSWNICNGLTWDIVYSADATTRVTHQQVRDTTYTLDAVEDKLIRAFFEWGSGSHYWYNISCVPVPQWGQIMASISPIRNIDDRAEILKRIEAYKGDPEDLKKILRYIIQVVPISVNEKVEV